MTNSEIDSIAAEKAACLILVICAVVSDAEDTLEAFGVPAIAGTPNASSVSSASLTTAQITSIKQAAFSAAMESISELVTGKTSYDGFRLAENNAVKITDHEGSANVLHTPTYSVSDGVLTLDTNGLEINQSALQDALDLKAGSKGL